MTIASTLSAKQFACNGVTTQFSYPNKIFAASDLAVTLTDTIGNTYPFINFANAATGLSYSVQNVDVDTGCVVVMSAAPTNGWTLDVRSFIAETQSTSIKNQGSFLPELHEEAFDRATRQIQDLLRLSYTFGIHGPDIETTPWPALPNAAGRKGFALMFDPITGLPTLGTPNTQTITSGLLAPFLGLSATPAEITAAANLSISTIVVNIGFPVGDLRRYGADMTGATDSSTALSYAAALLAVSSQTEILWPSGTIKYATAPNFGLANTSHRALGNVTLNFTGTGNCMVFDGGSVGVGVTNVRMVGDFNIKGAAPATNGVFVRAVHHSEFNFRVLGVPAAGLVSQWCICTKFNFRVSSNEGAFTPVTPVNGAIFDQRTDASHTTTDCDIYAIVEGVSGDGIQLPGAAECVFRGTSEANGGKGVNISSANSIRNVFIAFDTEVNTGDDYTINSDLNVLIACVTRTNLHVASGHNNQVIGGDHTVITLDAGAVRTRLLSPSNTTVMTDNGTNTIFQDVWISGANYEQNVFEKPIISALTLSGTWGGFGGGEALPGVSITGSKTVQLQGSIAGGAAGSAITTLPAGNRPSGLLVFECFAPNGATFALDMYVLSVDVTGVVKHVSGQTAHVILNYIHFTATQ